MQSALLPGSSRAQQEAPLQPNPPPKGLSAHLGQKSHMWTLLNPPKKGFFLLLSFLSFLKYLSKLELRRNIIFVFFCKNISAIFSRALNSPSSSIFTKPPCPGSKNFLLCWCAEQQVKVPQCLEHLLQWAHPSVGGSLGGDCCYPYCEMDSSFLTCFKLSAPRLIPTSGFCSLKVIQNPPFRFFYSAGSPETRENAANGKYICTSFVS